jgi:hypothetical protein
MDPDQLYGLPLDEFVPRRATLTKELRAAGDRAAAADVAALRKPSVAAWAVNQLVRTQPRAIKELYASGDALSAAQEQLMAGQADAWDLREANARERGAVDALISLARGLLTGEGNELSPGVLDRVSDTLNAAALDPEARAAVRDGRLERELRHSGLGAFSGAVAPVRSPSSSAPKRAPSAQRDAVRRPDPRDAERARTEARRAARVAEADARRRAEVAERAVHAAEQRREVAARTLAEVDDALARAHAELSAADEAHRSAKAALDEV